MPSFLPVDEQAAIGDQSYAAGLYPDTCFIHRQSGAVAMRGYGLLAVVETRTAAWAHRGANAH